MKSRETRERQSWGGERQLREEEIRASLLWKANPSALGLGLTLSLDPRPPLLSPVEGLLPVGVETARCSFPVPLPSQTIAENCVAGMPRVGVPCLAVLPVLRC